MSDTIQIILLGLGVLVALYVFLLYRGVFNRPKSVADKLPYADLIGKEITLKRDAYIAKNFKHFVNENPYILAENEEEIYKQAKPKYKLEAGTVIKIENAKLFSKPVSGLVFSYVLGRVFIETINKEVAFEYHWGKQITDLPKEKETYWEFPMALWQEEVLEEKFCLKSK